MVPAAVSLGGLVIACAAVATLAASIVGIIFRGAATAWRDERDAAVDKAERLEERVNEQAKEITTLKTQVVELQKRTDYETYAERSARDHRQILQALNEMGKNLHANTVALEFLMKQLLPTPTVPLRGDES